MQSFVLGEMIEYDAALRVRKPIFKVPSFVSEIVCYEPGQVTATHLHPKQDEIWLVLEGRGEIEVGEQRLGVQRSSLIYIPAKVRHGLRAAADSRLVLLFIKSPGIVDEAMQGSAGGPVAWSGPPPTPTGSQFLLEVSKTGAADARGRSREAQVDHLRREAEDLEQPRAAVARDGGDAHL